MFEDVSKRIAEAAEGIAESLADVVEEQAEMMKDPKVMKTEWTPLKGGGTNFQTHEFRANASIAEFRTTSANLIFTYIFMAVGIIVPLWLIIMTITYRPYSIMTLVRLLGGGMASIFFFIGFHLFRQAKTPIVFDRGLGYFWKGYAPGTDPIAINGLEDSCRLSEIEAIQVISEYIRGSSSSSSNSQQNSYHSYEINLVLSDTTRINVVDHGNKRRIFKDADSLGAFLGVPVWKKAFF